jgi:coenzyme Q-binding protein COQ10
MPTLVQSTLVDLEPEDAFDLVADVERYPEFLPFWRRATVTGRSDQGYETDQRVGVGLFVHRFRTRTELDRPRRIVVTSTDAMFSRFSIVWEFAPEGDGCRIDACLDCPFQSATLDQMLAAILLPTTAAMISAFEARVRDVRAEVPSL